MDRLITALGELPVATILVVIITVAGAVVTIVHPQTLPFDEYVKAIGLAVGLLAVGRGIRLAGQPTTPSGKSRL